MRKQLFPALSTCVLFLAIIFISLSWMRDVHPKAISQAQDKTSQETVSAAELAAAIELQRQAAANLTRSASFNQRFKRLSDKAQKRGTVPVIVRVRAAFLPEGKITSAAGRLAQRTVIKRAQDELLAGLSYTPSSLKRYSYIPYLAASVDSFGLAQLQASANVLDISGDKFFKLATGESLPLAGATKAWAGGFTGAGKTIAVLDSGIDNTHPELSGKVVAEACFSTTDPARYSTSLCPEGVGSSVAPGSGKHCTAKSGMDACDHGTHTAAIAAGRSGVAIDANIISIQVMSNVTDEEACGFGNCLRAFESDTIAALEHVFTLSETHSIAAANISLVNDASAEKYMDNCDDGEAAELKAIIDQLESVGIATVVASGNDEYTDGVRYPACISTAISVGATGDGSGNAPYDAVLGISNTADFLNLLAPGGAITSAIPGGGYATASGTSQAAAHESGAWALLKQQQSTATVDAILTKLRNTGLNMTRDNVTVPRISIGAALGVNPPDESWLAAYFNNPDLTGEPAARRTDGVGFLDRNFGSTSPAPGITTSNYSIRWTRNLTVTAGLYRFSLTGNDGTRLYIDDVLQVNEWTNKAVATSYTLDVQLDAGNHQVTVEYYHFDGPAEVRLSWARITTPCSQTVADVRWKGEYFNNTNLAGTAVMTRDDGGDFFNLNFGEGSPNPGCAVFPDWFSARWTRTVTLPANLYSFHLTADDGLRFFIDDQPILDRWNDYVGSTSVNVFLNGDPHRLRFELREGAIIAHAGLSWSTPCIGNPPVNRWRGEYFNNTQLTGFPLIVRDEGDGFINFNWGAGSPDSACVPGVDNFSARWTREVNFNSSGPWRFTVTTDDGVRLYVDGVIKIDKWLIQGTTTYTADVQLNAGIHPIKLEYFESGGAALASLSWEKVQGTGQCGGAPNYTLYPATGCVTGLTVRDGRCTRSDAFIDKCYELGKVYDDSCCCCKNF